ncbi:glycosyltransferase [Oryzomonas japonica]|uniref:Glycosyltransferase n=1 Tax=Oryzomonas japonica TaxID=2603858 RepID=A0A7J4ZQE6_9BACT|nr:glycosyltransferase family 2 protein [Oryzomonas japonica]KAB0665281.1 glycosyltransferase [Oryzomonas japonica]
MNILPKISLITVSFNSGSTIEDTIKSVANQNYPNIEYIVVDGLSTDNTLDILKSYPDVVSKVISEKDSGIYDAMNKGIMLATGDVVGILNADDFYVDENVITKVVQAFVINPIDALIADLVYVRPEKLDKIVRYYSSANFALDKFESGWMPPHPTFFVKRKCYDNFGLYKTDYKIAADFELLARFMVKNHISYHYLPEVIIKMRTGGASTKNLRSNLILNREIVRACAENDIMTNYFKVYSKYLTKLFQLVCRPR